MDRTRYNIRFRTIETIINSLKSPLIKLDDFWKVSYTHPKDPILLSVFSTRLPTDTSLASGLSSTTDPVNPRSSVRLFNLGPHSSYLFSEPDESRALGNKIEAIFKAVKNATDGPPDLPETQNAKGSLVFAEWNETDGSLLVQVTASREFEGTANVLTEWKQHLREKKLIV